MDQNKATVDLLNELYQNAAMGERGTALLMEKNSDAALSTQLHQHAADYGTIKNEAAALLSQCGQAPRSGGKMDRAAQWMGVQMNTLIDKTPSHMAEMLIQGSAMGIVKSEKNKRRTPGAAPQALQLEDRLIQLEQNYIETMKQFLN